MAFKRRSALCWVASLFFVGGATLLLLSLPRPYWHAKLEAPQYPQGLFLHVYVNRLDGDVREINLLNHYIGMEKLEKAAPAERRIAYFAIGLIALLVFLTGIFDPRWGWLFTMPAILFPFIFLADLQYWLWRFGTNLDPNAPLSQAIKPFVPPVLGVGTIGQFRTITSVGEGLIMAFIASFLVLNGLVLHLIGHRRTASR